MFPTLIFGSLLLLACLLYAFKPEKRFMPLVLSFGVMTIASGALGFSVGVITTFHYAAIHSPPPEVRSLAMLGVAESTNNIVLALIGIVIGALICSVGAVRIARVPAA
jgi:hypothetical protein